MISIPVRKVFRLVVHGLEAEYVAKVPDSGDFVDIHDDGFWGVVNEVDDTLRLGRRVLRDLSGRLRDPVSDIVHFLVVLHGIDWTGTERND